MGFDSSIRLSAAHLPNTMRASSALENAWNVGGALKTAKSAYNNERFASVVEQLADPQSSLTMALMRAEAGHGASVGYAEAQYADNG